MSRQLGFLQKEGIKVSGSVNVTRSEVRNIDGVNRSVYRAPDIARNIDPDAPILIRIGNNQHYLNRQSPTRVAGGTVNQILGVDFLKGEIVLVNATSSPGVAREYTYIPKIDIASVNELTRELTRGEIDTTTIYDNWTKTASGLKTETMSVAILDIAESFDLTNESVVIYWENIPRHYQVVGVTGSVPIDGVYRKVYNLKNNRERTTTYGTIN